MVLNNTNKARPKNRFFLDHGKRLKKSTNRLRQRMADRISGSQNEVPTFHDNYLTFFISRMMEVFPKDDWESSWQKIQGPEAQWVKKEVTRLQLTLAAENQGRYVSMDARKALADADADQTVLRAPFGDEIAQHDMTMSQGRTECMQWKGLPLFKTVYDFSLMSMLMWEIKPKTIIELGSGSGASALWMADMAKTFDLECRVQSLDINKPELETNAVDFIEGDCSNIAASFPADTLDQCPHPWIIIEDAHVNVHGVITHFAAHMRTGDYLIVEDSRVEKMQILNKWATENDNTFKIDTKYTDFFGRNATCSPDSFFVRM